MCFLNVITIISLRRMYIILLYFYLQPAVNIELLSFVFMNSLYRINANYLYLLRES